MDTFETIFRYLKSTQLVIISVGVYVGILLLAGISDSISNTIKRTRRKNTSYKTSNWRRVLEDLAEGVPIEVIKTICNSAVCTAYVYSTYVQEISMGVWILYRVVGVLASVEFLFFFALAERKVTYCIDRKVRYARLFNLVSIPSLFIPGGKLAYFNLAFLRIFCVLKSYEIIAKEVETKYKSYFYERNKENIALFMKFFALIYILAAGFQQAEITESYVPIDIEAGEWSWFNSIWFIVVTLSTVGYGDFSPATIQGRAFVMIMIVLVINIGYNEYKDRLDTSLKRKRGQGKFCYVRNLDHIIIIGNPALEELEYFIKELYALYSDKVVRERGSFMAVRDTPLAHSRKKVVVLLENLRWSVSEWNEMVADNVQFKKKIDVLVGKYDDKNSFKRAKLESALAVFILTRSSPERNSANTDIQFEADKRTVELALRVRKENKDVPIYSQTLLDESNIPICEALEVGSDEDYNDEKVTCINNNICKPRKVDPRHPREVLWDHEKRCLKRMGRWYTKRENKEPKCSDEESLLRSYNLSLESFFTSLLVANIKANGLSTLLTNLYFDFGFSDSDTDPWLKEFHMGAASKILPAFIPKAFRTHTIQSLSPLLAAQGLVLIGFKAEDSAETTPVLDVKMNYPEGAVGFFLTYLDIHDLCIALRLIRTQLDLKEPIRIQKITTTPTPKLDPARNIKPFKNRMKWNPLNPLMFLENDETATHYQDEEGEIQELRGHVIVSMDFERHSTTTDRLYNFQKLLRKNEELLQGKDYQAHDTIVVIHPTFWKPFSDDNDIYFVPGNSNKRSTWQRANFKHCRAIITMSDKNMKHSEADENTLFTLMMLDKHTDPKQNIYICSEILKEKSLRLFRTPRNERRTATKLGTERIERSGEGYYRNGSKTKDQKREDRTPDNITENSNCCNAAFFKKQTCDRAARKSERDMISSSVRYTSGELVVYSSASSLLVREYSEPGFIDFIMSLCGGGSKKNFGEDERQDERQKVFCLSIPEKIFEEGKDDIEYEVIFLQIIALGATPMGLYRSGKAPVLLPANTSRKLRGEDIRTKLKKAEGKARGAEVADDTPIPYGAAKNKLPYVLTLPEMKTRVHKLDGVYVLYDPSKIDLYATWEGTEFTPESVVLSSDPTQV